MMKKKQLIAISLAAALVLASLSACGGSTSEFNGDASCVVSNGYTLYVNGTALEGTN